MGDDDFGIIQNVLLNLSNEGRDAVAPDEGAGAAENVLYSELASTDAIVLVSRASKDIKWGIRMKKDKAGVFIIAAVDDNGPAGSTGAARLRPDSIVKSINGHDINAIPKSQLFAILGEAFELVIVITPPPVEVEDDTVVYTEASATAVDVAYEECSRVTTVHGRPHGTSLYDAPDSIMNDHLGSRSDDGNDGDTSQDADPIECITVLLTRDSVDERWGLKLTAHESIYKIVEVGPTGIAVPRAKELLPGTLVHRVNGVASVSLEKPQLGTLLGKALTLSLVVQLPQIDGDTEVPAMPTVGVIAGEAGPHLDPAAVLGADDASTVTITIVRETTAQRWGLRMTAAGNNYLIKGVAADGAAAAHANMLPEDTLILRMNGTASADIEKEDLKELLMDSLALTLVAVYPHDADVAKSETAAAIPVVTAMKNQSHYAVACQMVAPSASDYGNTASSKSLYDSIAPGAQYDMARQESPLETQHDLPPLPNYEIAEQEPPLESQDDLPPLPDSASHMQPTVLHEGEQWDAPLELPLPPQYAHNDRGMWVEMDHLDDSPTHDVVMLYRYDVNERWGLQMMPSYSENIPPHILDSDNEAGKARWKTGYTITGVGASPNAILEHPLNIEEAVEDGTREATAVEELPIGTKLIAIRNMETRTMDDTTLSMCLKDSVELHLLVERPYHTYTVKLERRDGELWGLHLGKTPTGYTIQSIDGTGAAAPQADMLPPGAEVLEVKGQDDPFSTITSDLVSASDFQKILVSSNALVLKMRMTNDGEWRRTKLELLGGRADYSVRRRFNQVDTDGAEVAWIDASDNNQTWVRSKWPFRLEANPDQNIDVPGFIVNLTVSETHPDSRILRGHTASCTRSWPKLLKNCAECGGTTEQPRRCHHTANPDAATQRTHLCEGCGPMMVVDGDVISAINGHTLWRDVMHEMNTKDVLQFKFKTHKRLGQVGLQRRWAGWRLDQRNHAAYTEIAENEDTQQDHETLSNKGHSNATSTHAREPSLTEGPTAADIRIITYNIYECKPTEQSAADFEEYVKLAQNHEEEQQFSDALTEYSKALEILENEGYDGPDGVEVTIPYYFVAFAFIGMGRCYMSGCRYQRATDFFNDYLRIAETLLGRFSTPELYAVEFPEGRDMLMMGLTHLGTALYHQRMFAEARVYHEQCRELAGDWSTFSYDTKKRYPQFVSEPEDIRYLMGCAANIGNTYGGQGDFVKARLFHDEQLRFARLLNDTDAESRANFNLENDCASSKLYGVTVGHKIEKERLRESESAVLNDTFGDRQGRDMHMGWLSKHGGHDINGPSKLSNARVWCVLSTKPRHAARDTDSSGNAVENAGDVNTFQLFETTQAGIEPITSIEISLVTVSLIEMYNQPDGKHVPPHRRSFRIVTVKRNEKGRIAKQKVYYFTADNSGDADAWVNTLNKAQTTNPRSWTMRKQRAVGTPYTPKRPAIKVVELEVDDGPWHNHMENPTGFRASGHTQYNPLFDTSPMSFESTPTGDGYLMTVGDVVLPGQPDFDERDAMEGPHQTDPVDAAFKLQLQSRLINDSATDAVGLNHDGHAEFETEHIGGVERIHQGDTLALLAASTAGALSCGVTFTKKYQQNAIVESIDPASPFKDCDELANGVQIVSINGQETWDLSYDGLNALMDEAEAVGTMTLAVPKTDLSPYTKDTVLSRDTPSEAWGVFFGWNLDAGAVVTTAINVGSAADRGGLRSGDAIVVIDNIKMNSADGINDTRDAMSDAIALSLTIERWKANPTPAEVREIDANGDTVITREEHVASSLRESQQAILPGCRVVPITRQDGEKWGMHMRYDKVEQKYFITGVADDGAASGAAGDLLPGTEVLAINDKYLITLAKKDLQVLLVESMTLKLLVRGPDYDNDSDEVDSILRAEVGVMGIMPTSTPVPAVPLTASTQNVHSAEVATNSQRDENELRRIAELDREIARLGQIVADSSAGLDDISQVEREAHLARARQEKELAALRHEEELERLRRLKEIEQLEMEMVADRERRSQLEVVAKARQLALDQQRRKSAEIDFFKLEKRKSSANLDRQRQDLEHEKMYRQLENEAEEERRRYEDDAARLRLEGEEEALRRTQERELESMRLAHEVKVGAQRQLLEETRLKQEAEMRAHNLELKRLRKEAAMNLHREELQKQRNAASGASLPAQGKSNGWTRVAEMIAKSELKMERWDDVMLRAKLSRSGQATPYVVELKKADHETWGISTATRDDGPLVITALTEGMAAERLTRPIANGGGGVRLLTRQWIEEVNGRSTRGLRSEDLEEEMRGKSEISLTVRDQPDTVLPRS